MPRRLEPGARLVIATHNPGKLREINELLRPRGLKVVSAGELGLPEPEEDAPDFAGNARIKALAAAVGAGLPALADDSGFCVAALGGAPGVLSARWAGPDKDFAPAMEREDFRAAMAAMAALRGPIDAFFEAVQVNTQSQVIRRNRLNLLSRIRAICLSVADLTKIEG